ncbi:MAG: IS630 family transposase [Chloroflexota bacterium]
MRSPDPPEAWLHAKKKSLRPSEQRRKDVAAERRAWRAWLPTVDMRRLVFLDETGAKTNMTRGYARSRKGRRAVDCAPHGHWGTTTLTAAVTWNSAIAPMVLDGSMDGVAFEAYVEQVLIPALPPGSIVVMDNLSAHKSPTVARLLRDAGAEVRYLPPYSPDFNPIEKMWSKIKSILRSLKPRTQEALYDAVAAALREVSPTDIQGYFLNSCVAIQ